MVGILVTRNIRPDFHSKMCQEKRKQIVLGGMEMGENICEAAVREVLAETGLIIECTAFLVKCADGNWIKFMLMDNTKADYAQKRHKNTIFLQ